MRTKESLINEYEAQTETGVEICRSFRMLVREFVKLQCKEHNSVEIEQMLGSELSGLCGENRLFNALDKKRDLVRKG